MAGNRNPIGHGLERACQFFDQSAGAVERLFGALWEHGSAVLVDDFNVQSEWGFLDHDLLGKLVELWKTLERLTQRGRSARESFVIRQLDTRVVHVAVATVVVGGRRLG